MIMVQAMLQLQICRNTHKHWNALNCEVLYVYGEHQMPLPANSSSLISILSSAKVISRYRSINFCFGFCYECGLQMEHRYVTEVMFCIGDVTFDLLTGFLLISHQRIAHDLFQQRVLRLNGDVISSLTSSPIVHSPFLPFKALEKKASQVLNDYRTAIRMHVKLLLGQYILVFEKNPSRSSSINSTRSPIDRRDRFLWSILGTIYTAF